MDKDRAGALLGPGETGAQWEEQDVESCRQYQ